MKNIFDDAGRLRILELSILGIGVLLGLAMVAWTSADAFQANTAGTKGGESLFAILVYRIQSAGRCRVGGGTFRHRCVRGQVSWGGEGTETRIKRQDSL